MKSTSHASPGSYKIAGEKEFTKSCKNVRPSSHRRVAADPDPGFFSKVLDPDSGLVQSPMDQNSFQIDFWLNISINSYIIS